MGAAAPPLGGSRVRTRCRQGQHQGQAVVQSQSFLSLAAGTAGLFCFRQPLSSHFSLSIDSTNFQTPQNTTLIKPHQEPLRQRRRRDAQPLGQAGAPGPLWPARRLPGPGVPDRVRAGHHDDDDDHHGDVVRQLVAEEEVRACARAVACVCSDSALLGATGCCCMLERVPMSVCSKDLNFYPPLSTTTTTHPKPINQPTNPNPNPYPTGPPAAPPQ